MVRSSDKNGRRYWVWIADERSYLDEEGKERAELDPRNGLANEGWWTCHKDTKKGDLILLYRSRLKKDIGYLVQAGGDAYSIANDEIASSYGWDYGCDDEFLYKFDNPLTFAEMRENPYLQDWGGLRGNFQKRVYEIPISHWKRLNGLLGSKNRGYGKFLAGLEESKVSRSIVLEEELEEALVQDLSRLKPFGFDLELCSEELDGVRGRQQVCLGHGGRMDLLCFDRKKKRYVVIELKNVRANQNTFGQVWTYVGWVQENIADKNKVVGLVISRGFDVRFQTSMRLTDRIFHLDLADIGFE